MTARLSLALPRRSRCCSEDGKAFEPGEVVYSVLVLDEGEENYRRLDYSEKHGESKIEAWSAAGLTYWKGRTPSGVQPRFSSDTSRVERAEILFREALASDSAAEAFVLCLYLQRLKRLSFRRELMRKKGNYRLSVYEFLSGETVLVPRLELSPEEVLRVQEVLALKLKGEPSVLEEQGQGKE